MRSEHFITLVNSEQPEQLRTFYQDVIGLVPKFEFAPGAFGVNGSALPALIIEEHSEVSGRSREPQRILLNFLVGDTALEASRLQSRGVEFLRPPYVEEGVGMFATFLDPDGNYCQLVQLHA